MRVRAGRSVAVIVVASLCACTGDDGKPRSRGGAGAGAGMSAVGGAGAGAGAGMSAVGGTSGGAAGLAAGMSAGGQSGGSAGAGSGGSGGAAGSAGTSGAAGTGTAGPCRGLECDQTSCVAGPCTQMPCAAGSSTTVSGTVYDPAGKVPLYGVTVYVPNGAVPPAVDGASCAPCDAGIADAVTSARTGVDGRFVLPDAPVGGSVPLVIQIGKWRRQITVSVARCAETELIDVEQTSLPSKQSEGDIPLIAVATGGGDSLECLPLRMGVEPSEFTAADGNGRVHLYAGTDGPMAVSTKALDSGTALPHADNLWNNVDALARYDIVILSCEADAEANQRPLSARQAMADYASIGGGVFASHWHHRWISEGPDPLPTVGTFSDRENPPLPALATINTAFPKGQALAEWLLHVGASTVLGEIDVLEARDNVQAVNPQLATEWLRVVNENELGTPAIQLLSFDMPLDADLKCGRVVYADFEVSNTEGTDPTIDAPGSPFPSSCSRRDLSAQEKAAEFLLFELSCL